MTDHTKIAALGQADTVAALERLLAQVKAGEVNCAALRVFKPDGTWEDLAFGGTAEDQAAALAKLRAEH